MNGAAKGSFWDRIKLRFKKIKLFFKKQKKKDIKELIEKRKKDKIKKKKEEELFYIYKKQMKKEKQEMIIPDKKEFKENPGVTIAKVILIPTTLILNAIKPNNKRKKLELDKEKKDNLNQNIKIQEKYDVLEKTNEKSNINKTNNKIFSKITIKKEKNQNKKEKDILNNTFKNSQSKNNLLSDIPIITNYKNDTKKEQIDSKKNPEYIENNNLNKENATKDIPAKNTKEKKFVIPKKGIIKLNNEEKLKKKLVLQKLDFTKYKNIDNELERKLEEQKEIYENFKQKIKNIKPEQVTEVKYKFISNLLANFKNVLFAVLSIPFLKKPKNIPMFAVGLYMLNNSIRNMRKIITKEETIKYIPSDSYISAIQSNLDAFGLIDYMLDDSLSQIQNLKSDYENKFGDYKYTDLYKKNIEQISLYEKKIEKKKKQFEKEKKKMNKNLEKNQKILRLIRDMND